MAFDLEKFNRQTWAIATETVAQEVDKFNKNSNNVIVLSAKPFEGDFDIRASFKGIAGLVRHRDVENGTNTITSKRLEQHKNVAVKVAAGTPEILWQPAQYQWILQNPENGAVVIGTQLGRAMLADMLNTGIKAGVSALKGNSEVVENGTAKAIDFAVMTKGASRFGDRASSLAAWVLHSGALSQLQLNALNNNERLFSYENVNVFKDPFGRILIVTDSPDLTYNDSGVKYNTLGLTEGGIVVSTQDDFYSVIVPKTGTENISNAYQAEWSYGLSVKGYSWDMTAGGNNPNAGTLATPTNWKKTATSSKDTAGVLLQTQ